MTFPTVYIVSPVYNEKQNTEVLVKKIREISQGLEVRIRILLVNDGSDSETTKILENLARNGEDIGVIHLSRNFGHQAALSAGLAEACQLGADAVISMDSDLQHPPRLIPELLAQWKCGYDVVYTVRNDHERTSLFKRVTARLFYSLVDAMSEHPVPPGAADFRLLGRGPLEALVGMPERARFLRGLTSWIGFRQVGIHYVPDARLSGSPKYTLKRMYHFAVDGIVSMTTLPLKISLFVGLFVSFLSLIYLLYVVYAHFLTNRTLPGWSSVIVAVLFLGGMNLTLLGVMGLYLAKVFEEVKGRPLYLVRAREGFGSRPPETP